MQISLYANIQQYLHDYNTTNTIQYVLETTVRTQLRHYKYSIYLIQQYQVQQTHNNYITYLNTATTNIKQLVLLLFISDKFQMPRLQNLCQKGRTNTLYQVSTHNWQLRQQWRIRSYWYCLNNHFWWHHLQPIITIRHRQRSNRSFWTDNGPILPRNYCIHFITSTSNT
jgi:hypothetical protein